MECKTQAYLPALETSLLENMQMFKALGDETRLRILGLLSHGELCVCDIMAVLELPQSTASRHLSYLRNSKWVSGIRRGKWMYYQLTVANPDDSIRHLIIRSLADLVAIQIDHQKLICHLKNKDKYFCT
jgi:ArsR family transcriptional regulator, arsenate/arsenite/antimonite-responsive transcriptional repressor